MAAVVRMPTVERDPARGPVCALTAGT